MSVSFKVPVNSCQFLHIDSTKPYAVPSAHGLTEFIDLVKYLQFVVDR